MKINQLTFGLSVAAIAPLLGGVLGLAAPSANAYEAGDWLVRGRVINVEPNESSKTITSSVAGGIGGWGADNDVVPELDFTYMLHRHVGVELILATSQHDVKGKGGVTGTLGKLFDARTLPPTLLVQYHFLPDAKVKPYVGAGINYTLFFDEDASGALKAAGGGRADVELESSFGPAAQAGMDIAINKDWFVNVDVKYIDMDSKVTINTNALGRLKTDAHIDPWVYGIGIGRRF